MDFYDVIARVIELLQREGRVSYRVLKRQFSLDDDFVEDLKSTPDAERRQLTVMFCDLADSTNLSSQLDPEDLRDVIRAYQSTSAEMIERYDGYIAQHLGDGLMVYFGWPQAHEDDAQHAIHAGLGMIEAMRQLNAHLEQEKGIRLTVRIGIHTGLVVVGEIGQGVSQEHLALGETPNVASRIEGVAESDTIAISDATYRLIQGYFICEDLGLYTLKGVTEPQPVYRIVGTSGAQDRLDVGVTRGLAPLVGREQEVGLFVERWRRVQDGRGQVVVLSGEAGIGKSRLLQVLKDSTAGEAHTLMECRSSPYFQNTALYPITDMLQRTFQWQQDDLPAAKLDKLEQTLRQYSFALDESVALFATLLSLPLPAGRYPSVNLSPQQKRQKTLETIVALLLQQAESRPVLFVVEDLHWTDPSTLELLELLIDQTPTAALCVLLTCRPAFQVPWRRHSYFTQITLSYLSRPQVEQVVEWVAGGKRLPAEVLHQIVEKTDGVPLFVEELTKAVLEGNNLTEVDGHYELAGSLASLAIPTTLQDALMARLDRLGAAKAIAQLGATIGRQFSYALIRAVSPLDDLAVWQNLVQLVEAELLYQRGSLPQATFTFKHVLIQDAAYASLLRRTRQQLHQQIGQILEAQFPNTKETQPELLAHHYTEAGLYEPAITWWQRASEHARRQFAFFEANRHLAKGIALSQSLATTPERMQRELDMQLVLGQILRAVYDKSVPEYLRAYTRARTLCEQLGNTRQLFDVLLGFAYYYQEQGASQQLQETNEELLALAQAQQDVPRLVQAHNLLGQTLRRLGKLISARYHLEQAIDLYNLHGQSPSTHLALETGYLIMSCLFHYAIVLCTLGYPDAIPTCISQMRKWAQDTP